MKRTSEQLASSKNSSEYNNNNELKKIKIRDSKNMLKPQDTGSLSLLLDGLILQKNNAKMTTSKTHKEAPF